MACQLALAALTASVYRGGVNEGESRSIRTRLRRVILPQTHMGWVALCLVFAFLAIFQISQMIAAGGDATPWLAFFVVPMAVSGLGGGIAAAVAIARRGERGVLVFVPLVFGLLIVLFVVGELTTQH